MNRIILIGNGFDLAHRLPTSYGNFIDWYWNEWLKKLMACVGYSISDELCKFSLQEKNNIWMGYLYNKISRLNPPKGRDFLDFLKGNSNVEISKCPFLNNICQSIDTKGWVDIENEYYNLLVSSSNNDNIALNHQILNNQLKCLQDYLVEYLKRISIDAVNIIPNIKNIISSPINPQDISVSEKEQIISHAKYWINCSDIDFDNKIRNYNVSGIDSSAHSYYRIRREKFDLENIYKNYSTFFLPDHILMLNFNYTSTANKYAQENKSIIEVNHIHGELSNPDSVIFGYGDELDENYKKLSNLNDNEYLKNFKSIKYLESDRYRKALQFMDAAPYQVFIMGHSCGNSDRTLLNTLFEHKNCISIKPYYYKNGDKDNYLEIVQNISRNFTDMKLMRDRVVNKTYCEPFSIKVPSTISKE